MDWIKVDILNNYSAPKRRGGLFGKEDNEIGGCAVRKGSY